MRYWPNARYRRDDGLTHIPNLASICVYYRQWPHAITRPVGEPQHPALAYRKPKPDFVPIPDPENSRLWELRRQAAARYEAEYRQNGRILPFPRITSDNANDPHALAEAEGWHDFAARHPEVRGTLYVDYMSGADNHELRVLSAGQGPAIPQQTRHNPVQEAHAISAAKQARAAVRQQRLPAELKELAVKRVVADELNPPPQTIRLSRQRIIDKFPQPAFHFGIQGLNDTDRDLARRINDLSDWLKGMGFASHADTANRTANLTRKLTPAFRDLLSNRSLFNRKPSRSCRTAEARLLPKASQSLDRLAEFANQQAEAQTDTPWGPAWQATANRIAEAGQFLTRHPMPEQESPYETDEYERLATMSAAELNRIAIRSTTRYRAAARTKERGLLLPNGWTAAWTESPSGSTEPDITCWTPTYGYDIWADYLQAFATPQHHATPEELVAEADPNLSDMKPTECQDFVHRLLTAVFTELEQRAHTMPPEMHQPALDAILALGTDVSRQEHYTAGRYRQVIRHTADAYLACRFPGRWETAAEALQQALDTPRRNAYRNAGTEASAYLRQWLHPAQSRHADEMARQRQQAEQGAADPGLIWQAVISATPKVSPAPAVAIAATAGSRRRREPAPTARLL